MTTTPADLDTVTTTHTESRATYTILKLLEGYQWELVATVQAINSATAIRATTNIDGTYVAVPARSWKPVTVHTETKTVTRLETAT